VKQFRASMIKRFLLKTGLLCLIKSRFPTKAFINSVFSLSWLLLLLLPIRTSLNTAKLVSYEACHGRRLSIRASPDGAKLNKSLQAWHTCRPYIQLCNDDLHTQAAALRITEPACWYPIQPDLDPIGFGGKRLQSLTRAKVTNDDEVVGCDPDLESG